MTTALASYSEELQNAVSEELHHIYVTLREWLVTNYEKKLSEEKIHIVFFMYFGIYYIGFIDPKMAEIDIAKGISQLFLL